MNYLRVYAKINLDAIRNNIEAVKTKVGLDKKIMVIVKADGYGHGAAMLSRKLDDLIDYLGVAIIEEAIELRKKGINKPILVLGYTPLVEYSNLIENDITQTIFTLKMAKELSEVAGSMNKKATVHIKIDTGMGRIGFKDNEDSIKEIKEIMKLPNLFVEGIFTHYANADEADKTRARVQYKRYEKFVDELENQGIKFSIRHISNSAGIMEFEDEKYDMVRSGIITYGLYPSEEVDYSKLQINPAMEIKTHVIFVKTVDEGSGISYNSTYIAQKPTKVATVPVGYADGYPRLLSSKGRVLVNGQFAPIIGRICMDQFMIDVTDIEQVKEGDIVTLVGKDGDNFIPLEEPANLSGRFNYEFICDISKRVPRVYFEDNKVVGIENHLAD